MRDAVDYLFSLSDPELVRYWELFGEYPTHDRHQRARLDRAVRRLAKERPQPKSQPQPQQKVRAA